MSKPNDKRTLILWLDAFRPDYLSKHNAPFLYSMGQSFGVGSLKPVFGYSSIAASFYTGVYPEKHGQLMLYKYGSGNRLGDYGFLKFLPKKIRFYLLNLYRYYVEKKDFFVAPVDYNLAKIFSIAQEYFYVHQGSLNAPTLFNVLEKNNLRYLIYQWPYVANNSGSKLIFGNNFSDSSKINQFLRLINRNKADVYMIHLWDLDKFGHLYGPDSKNLIPKIKEQDRLVKTILSNFSVDFDNIVIWSDHGMLPIQKTINLYSKLKNLKCTYFLDSTMARFWFSDEKNKQKTIKLLNQLPDGHLLTPDEKRKFRIQFGHKFYGEEFFLVNPGTLICPNFFQNHPVNGMHGYDLSNRGEYGFFLVNQRTKAEGEMVDLFPTILEMIGIENQPDVDGMSLIT